MHGAHISVHTALTLHLMECLCDTSTQICYLILQASSIKGRMVVCQGGELVTVPNIEAILEDFAVLGEGLVQAVEARSERWTV